jgi:hypothetical protein
MHAISEEDFMFWARKETLMIIHYSCGIGQLCLKSGEIRSGPLIHEFPSEREWAADYWVRAIDNNLGG